MLSINTNKRLDVIRHESQDVDEAALRPWQTNKTREKALWNDFFATP